LGRGVYFKIPGWCHQSLAEISIVVGKFHHRNARG
jgi:hypothetical protein